MHQLGFLYPVVTHWAWGGGWLQQGLDYQHNGTTHTVSFTVSLHIINIKLSSRLVLQGHYV